MVAGVASVVLLGIAASTVEQVLQNELNDKLTETAVEGGVMIKKIAENNNNSTTETLFPPITGNTGKCFALNNNVNAPAFQKNGDVFVNACNYDSQGKDGCTDYKSQDSSIFRVYCMTSDSDINTGTTVGKIIVGLSACKQNDTSGKCSIADYPYYIVVKTTQK
ncbi:MAG TPA: hypothetical protein VHA74_01375 [Candidatus Dojkabacteria bacterium]|nr:hypothetical protein [Candidatus Dojkabacteria bacterium]